MSNFTGKSVEYKNSTFISNRTKAFTNCALYVNFGVEKYCTSEVNRFSCLSAATLQTKRLTWEPRLKVNTSPSEWVSERRTADTFDFQICFAYPLVKNDRNSCEEKSEEKIKNNVETKGQGKVTKKAWNWGSNCIKKVLGLPHSSVEIGSSPFRTLTLRGYTFLPAISPPPSKFTCRNKEGCMWIQRLTNSEDRDKNNGQFFKCNLDSV